MSTKALQAPGFLRRAQLIFPKEAGPSFGAWALIAALNLGAQIAFRRELAPGEFGTLNTALGMLTLLTLPAFALHQAVLHYLARTHPPEREARIESLRHAAPLVVEHFAWLWGALCLALVFVLLPLVDLPRFSLQLLLLLNVLMALGGLVSWTLCQNSTRTHLWTKLLVASVVTRVFLGVALAKYGPWTESVLAAFLLAGFISLIPALSNRNITPTQRWESCLVLIDRDFLLCAAATFSVLLGIFLFSSADRLVAQSWFGVATDNNLGVVNWAEFDAYQTAGLIARALLWGTQPLLWILFAQRTSVEYTRASTLTFFWIYLGALLVGALVMGILASSITWVFCGDNYHETAQLVPSLLAAMVPLGLLQAVGVFSLASRRYPECFVLGACSISYTLLLYLFGRQAHLMPAYMFGGGLISLMVVLFVGVVRWGRKQP